MNEKNQKMETHHKFRLSDIMPNSWLYKLKGISISRSRKHFLSSSSSPKHISSSSYASSSRKLRLSSLLVHTQASSSSSSHPKASSKRRIKRRTVYKPSSRLKLSSSSSFRSHVSPLTTSRNHLFDSAIGSSSDQNHGLSCDLEADSVDIKDHLFVKKLDDVSKDLSLPEKSSSVRSKIVKEQPLEIKTQHKLKKQNIGGSLGIRIRANSPKIARKKTKRRASSEPKKKTEPESFAIVLTSMDPERDFRESMVEMIMENNMKEQKDLEDLLACYLSLNSSEYHDIIIKAFEKTWFHLKHLT